MTSKYENSNQFKDGLLMDLHPMQTPNTVLTDNLNGTLITYNGNEYTLQNDMGNFKLKNCKLNSGYLPIGTASYADTIYIMSYNPIDNNIELGSYPAPMQNTSSSNVGYKQIYSLIESYIAGNPSVNAEIKLKYSEIQQLVTKIKFDEKQFRLKRGDEYSVICDQQSKCGFEEFEYTIISDSGIEQRFEPTESGWNNVTWDSPGNIQIKNKLFEVDHSEYRILSKMKSSKANEIKILYELYIKDQSFIKKLDSEKDNIFTSSSKDYIDLNVKVDSIEVGAEKSFEVKPWLDEYRKIECIIRCSIPIDQSSDSEKSIIINIVPTFNTVLTLNQDGGTTFKVKLLVDSVSSEIETSISQLGMLEIGTKEFYWDGSGIHIDCEENLDYENYYKLDNDEGWSDLVVSDGKGSVPINLSDGIHMISFGRSRKEGDNEKLYVTSYLFYYYPDMQTIAANSELWYNIGIDKIYQHKYGKTFNSVSIEINPKSKLTWYDEGGKEGVYSKYFNRFDDPNIFFPSVIKDGTLDTLDTTQYFEVAKNATIKIKNLPNLAGKVVFYDRQDDAATPVVNNFSGEVQLKSKCWNKIQGEISQKGDGFYFADNVHYYKLNVGEEQTLHAITLDGGSKVSIGGTQYEWYDISPNNYRAIRMGCPSIGPNQPSGYGCKQMDFSVLSNHIDGMCQYIYNFHKIIRDDLDQKWAKPELDNKNTGHCEITGTQGTKVTLSARTYYRDAAQRPCFMNESGTINIFPKWDKWNKDSVGDNKHCVEKMSFIALPIYNTVSSDPKYQTISVKPEFEKMVRNEDYETFVNSYEKRTIPKITKSSIEMSGIGLACKETPDLYVAWIPNWENLDSDKQKFHYCHQMGCTLASNYINTPILSNRCEFWVQIDKEYVAARDTYLELNPMVINNVFPIGLSEVKVTKESYPVSWDKEEIDTLNYNIGIRCEEDNKNLTSHPIFKTFIGAKSSVSDRVKNYPVPGIYPGYNGTNDAFSGVNAFTPWKHFYVDGEGRPFITNLDASEHIYIYKNGRKRVFGYIPYVGESWESH